MHVVPIAQHWSLELDDEFRRQTVGEELVLWDGGRTVYASVCEADPAEAEQAIARMLAERGVAAERTYDRSEPGLVAHAHLVREGTTDKPYWGLNTWTASRGWIACVTLYFPTLDDLDWALAAWRTVRHGARPGQAGGGLLN